MKPPSHSSITYRKLVIPPSTISAPASDSHKSLTIFLHSIKCLEYLLNAQSNDFYSYFLLSQKSFICSAVGFIMYLSKLYSKVILDINSFCNKWIFRLCRSPHYFSLPYCWDWWKQLPSTQVSNIASPKNSSLSYVLLKYSLSYLFIVKASISRLLFLNLYFKIFSSNS